MALQMASLQISRDGEIFQKCHRDWVSRENACILESGSMLLALHHLSVLISYLSACSLWRNKDNLQGLGYSIPFQQRLWIPRILSLLTDEGVCSHASKRRSNNRCENRIRFYWETGSLLVEKSLSGLYTSVQITCSKGILPQHTEMVLSLFWEFLVKFPKT